MDPLILSGGPAADNTEYWGIPSNSLRVRYDTVTYKMDTNRIAGELMIDPRHPAVILFCELGAGGPEGWGVLIRSKLRWGRLSYLRLWGPAGWILLGV